MEARVLLAADFNPIQVGAVYYEDASGYDEAGDLIEITWTGGAADTELVELVIETDKVGDGLTIGDVFFDTTAGEPGAFQAYGLVILDQSGIDSVDVSVADGGTTLLMTFAGFDAGERLLLTVDVDEVGFLGPNAVAEGNEFEGSQLSATFTAPHYYDATGGDIFLDSFDAKLAGSGLDLPPDDYVPPGDVPTPIRTAGAIASLEQEPLPAALDGTVYEDFDIDNRLDPGEPGIEGVTLTLWQLDGDEYVATGRTTKTDSAGDYRFDDLAPGTYRVVETQPAGYESSGARAGTIDGKTVGEATTPDVISEVTLLGGQESVDNDFGEYRPASISGRVIADFNGNCRYDEGDTLLAGVTVELLDASGGVLDSTLTDSNGEYSFTGLLPGVYGVHEVQPDGYLDGGDHVGSAGGSLLPPDSVIDAVLDSGTAGVGYDFCEVLPVSISGFVYVDRNDNGQRNEGEEPIAGVELELLDADGKPTGNTTTTDEAGFYRFADLLPGTYGVAETQPEGFVDGKDAAGTAGGAAENPGDRITGAQLPPGTNAKNYNFGELLLASISGRVHAELNRDCIPDPGEPLLAGVTIHLLDVSGNIIDTTETDAAGEYSFTGLTPGVYGVREIQPEDYLDGRDHVGSEGGTLSANDQITEVTLGSGVDGVNYNFCELVPASISGYVFQDGPEIQVEYGETAPDPASVRDGRLTADDAPIAGVVLQLGDASGAPIEGPDGKPIIAVTDARGYYEFTGLEPGVYTILEVHPDGYIDSIDTPGSKGGLADNAHEPLEEAVLQQLSVDPNFDAIVRIPVAAGDEAVAYNFSEVVIVELPPPIIPPPPTPTPEPPGTTPVPYPQGGAPTPTFVPLPSTLRSTTSFLAGGGGHAYTWHLSVINGGQPRRAGQGTDTMFSVTNSYFNPAAWETGDMNRAEFVATRSTDEALLQIQFGMEGAVPVAGDFNGDGIAEVGIYFEGLWFIDLNGNGVWDEEDLWARLGTREDRPVVGDWDGDGKTDIGIFGPAWVGDFRAIEAEPGLPDAENATVGRFENLPPLPEEATSGNRALQRTAEGKMRTDVIDHVFRYGRQPHHPVAGDWNGDGVTNIGLFSGGTWYLDLNGDGRWSTDDGYVRGFGQEGDLPVVGDFNGDGVDDLGVYRAGKWLLDSNGDRRLDARDKVFELGGPQDLPVVADFDGDGIDDPAVYHARDPETPAPSAQAPPTQAAPAAPPVEVAARE